MASSLLAWLERLVGSLAAHDVPYAIAGGLALAAWDCPRATTDLDLVIAADPEVIARTRIAAAEAGLLQTRRAVARFRTSCS